MNYPRTISTRGVSALGPLLLLALLAPICAAQFRATDNFNRPDGPVGLGWSTYGQGAQISSNQLETFGTPDFGGGIQRNLNVTFPLRFSFNVSSVDTTNAGWVIGFNAASEGFDVGPPTNDTAEVILYQFSGSRALCMIFQTVSAPSTQCANLSKGQRNITAQALITGTLNADFSATVSIKFNDGLTPPMVTMKLPPPSGAVQTPLGSVLFFGNISAFYGPTYYNNFALTLI